MRVIIPTPITDAVLVSSTVAEPGVGETAWAAGTAYAVGALAYRATNHRVYRRLVAGTTATAPELDTTTWELAGSTNRWGMFDAEVSTLTQATSAITVVLDVGAIDSLAMAGLVGSTATITLTDGPAGPVVYSRVVDLSAANIYDWYTYFFAPFDQATSLVLQDLPPYTAGRLTIAIAGTGTVACGAVIAGNRYDLGYSQLGITSGIKTYSRKSSDAYGFSFLEKRKAVKTLRAQVQTEAGAFNAVHRLLEANLDVICAWIGDDTGELDPLFAIGFYRDFSLAVQYADRGFYSLQIEGTTV